PFWPLSPACRAIAEPPSWPTPAFPAWARAGWAAWVRRPGWDRSRSRVGGRALARRPDEWVCRSSGCFQGRAVASLEESTHRCSHFQAQVDALVPDLEGLDGHLVAA